ncbi:MAG: hypothetical protein M3Q63_03320 [bacterium]|nr:hypothetical protein [bacterium]
MGGTRVGNFVGYRDAYDLSVLAGMGDDGCPITNPEEALEIIHERNREKRQQVLFQKTLQEGTKV